nr:hypothetical protein BaRGS_026521 [Batillaria attramentaria]
MQRKYKVNTDISIGWTHRAAIQSTQDITVSVQGAKVTRHYALDMWRGEDQFCQAEEAVFTETIRTEGLEIKHVTYAHQRLVQLLVTEIHVTRTDDGNEAFSLVIDRSEMNSTVDLVVTKPEDARDVDRCPDVCRHTYGHTLITETKFAEIGQVHVYWTEIPATLEMGSDQEEKTWIFVSSYDKMADKARSAFQTALDVMTSTPDLLLQTHEQAWADKWNSGRIDVEGDDDLDTIIHSSLYYILMSLPSTEPEMPLEQFYGLSPGSLARGANWTDYQGHVFWDMETWMYPPILVLFPDLARAMLSYRIYGGDGAAAKAHLNGYEGWQFPWESAFTGYEMTPDICIPCRDNQQHITGDVMFAARQYWSATHNEEWLQEEGGINLILQTAAFWASRAEYNQGDDRYEINGVMPPDEYAENINNSIYTNYVAKLNLNLGGYAACLAGLQLSETDRWAEVADKLYLVFNDTTQHHPEYEGYDNIDTAYNNNQVVKQADTVMLGYPLGMDMADEVRRNDLELYADRGDPNGPAMTWSMFTINWLDLANLEMAAENFNKSYSFYRRRPFNTWTEAKTGLGATNFITGMGGFLQAVIFGYAGMRIELEHLSFHPRLPPNTNKMKVTGLDYLGSTFDLLITDDKVLVIVREQSASFPLQLTTKAAGSTWQLKKGMELSLKREPFVITSLNVTECPMPEGSSCPDVATVETPGGVTASLSANIHTVRISQTGGEMCTDFIQCSYVVSRHMVEDNTINFFIGSDGRIYQGAPLADQAGVLRVAMLGDYTLHGMSVQQEAVLRRLVKCGMEQDPPNVHRDYKLQYTAQAPEDCGSAPCAVMDTVFSETIRTEGLEIKHVTYAHQRLVQVLVTQIHVTRTDGGNKAFTLMIDRSEMNSTIDLAITDPEDTQDINRCPGVCRHTYGHTLITETKFAEIGQVHVYWTEIPATLEMGSDQEEKTWIFVSSYDKMADKARSAFQTALDVMTSTPDLLLQTHEQAWADKWNSGRIDAEGIMPPDEFAENINNSIYTNYVAKLNLNLGGYAACLAGLQLSETDRWAEVADKLYLVFNDTTQHHPEYEGYDNIDTAYNHNQSIKIADAFLLGYPLGYNMPQNVAGYDTAWLMLQVHRNDMELYSQRVIFNGPAMTWSMVAINWLDLGEMDKAEENFHKSYSLYRRKPFNAIMFGYAGLRVELEKLTFRPLLPLNITRLTFTGIKYLASTFDIVIMEQKILLAVRNTSPDFPLQLMTEKAGTTWVLVKGMELSFDREPFEISSLSITECPTASDDFNFYIGNDGRVPNVHRDYKLQYTAQAPEDCGSAPCAGVRN